MQFKSVRALIKPLIQHGHRWQNISINGEEQKPRFYFSKVQLILLLASMAVLLKLQNGISKDIIGYIMSAFSIAVSLFMSLLVSIFDKFENTKFDIDNATDLDLTRFRQKKNFFKRFISITSYLVVLSILIIILCSFTYVFDLSDKKLSIYDVSFHLEKIDIFKTLKASMLLVYRIALNYFLLNYLYLTFFITGSAFEYYMSELNNRKISV